MTTEVKDLKNRYELKELELDSLLEITQAINENLPEKSLYKIYEFILRANLNLKKLALFVLDEKWKCKVNYGTERKFNDFDFEDKFLILNSLTKIDELPGETHFNQFDIVIPIRHKTKKLAFIFIDQAVGSDAEVNTKFIKALSNILIVAIENKKLANKEKEQVELRKEMEIASEVQQYLFPKTLPYSDVLKVHASYLPHHNIGGDYYDFLQINENDFLFCIADVSGKGIPAAILMSNFQASLHTLVRSNDADKSVDLKTVVSILNEQILQNANGESFITFFVAIYDKRERTLRYINSGHNPPYLLLDGGKKLLALEEGSTILGAFEKLPFINQGELSDVNDFMLFAYTDGLTETSNSNGEEFGTERLEHELNLLAKDGLRKMHGSILEKLNAFKGEKEYFDDITMLSCKVKSS